MEPLPRIIYFSKAAPINSPNLNLNQNFLIMPHNKNEPSIKDPVDEPKVQSKAPKPKIPDMRFRGFFSCCTCIHLLMILTLNILIWKHGISECQELKREIDLRDSLDLGEHFVEVSRAETSLYLVSDLQQWPA
jgi:hypothetical protein